jgi:hypothetical protein
MLMPDESIDTFLSVPRIAVLTTLDQDRMPVTTPLWYDWDGSSAWMFSFKDAGKVRRARADDRGWLLVHACADEPEDWVALRGVLRVSSDGWPVAQRLAPRYWDMSLDAKQQTLASWEAAAGDLVAIELAVTHRSRMPAD